MKGFSENYFVCKSCPELSSVLVTLASEIFTEPRKCTLHNARTDWPYLRELLTSSLNTKIPLKSEEDIGKAIEHFNDSVQAAAWESSPLIESKDSRLIYSNTIRLKVAEKKISKEIMATDSLSMHEEQTKSTRLIFPQNILKRWNICGRHGDTDLPHKSYNCLRSVAR